MQVALIPAVEEDKAEIWDMFVSAMRPHIEKIWGWEDSWQTNEFNSRFFELNTSFIAANGNKLGYVQYSLNEADTYLNMVILSPNSQGQSLGKYVLNEIQGVQQGKPLKLRCFHVNERALNFYKKNGFGVIGSEENFVLLERNT